MSDPKVEQPNEVSAVMGIINKYPKLTLIVLALLFGGSSNVGTILFNGQQNGCDPELKQHIEDIKASQAEAKVEAKTTTDKVDDHLEHIKITQTAIKEDVSEIRTDQAVMRGDLNHIKEDVEENKDDIKDIKNNN